MTPSADAARRRASAIVRGMRPLAALLLCAACAGPGGAPPPSPVPVFVRPRGVWSAEELQRDVVECSDAVREKMLAEPAWLGSPRGAAAAAYDARVVACMNERGWTTGAVAPEEWAQ
jgi:hypothetical protein